MTNQRWSADQNIKFINEYQRNECLWDTKHPKYKNRYAREAAYKEIMEVMQMETVRDVVGKIRTLRNTFNNETLKTKKSNTTGMETNDLYVSKIPWLSHMNFLKNIDSFTRENMKNEEPNFTEDTSVSELSIHSHSVWSSKMTNQRWSADQNIKFINEYQRNECLWNSKHPQYKNKNARKAAYKEIKEVMQMETEKEVVSKIRTLRNTYNNEIMKTKKSNTLGMETNDLYVSKIPWLPHMDFIKNIDEGYTRENMENEAPSFIEDTSDSEPSTGEFTEPSTLTTKKRKIKDTLLKALDALEMVSSQHFSNASNDEFDLFAQTIAQQLRQLPLEYALETEEMILSTIRRQRIRVARLTQKSRLSFASVLLPSTSGNNSEYEQDAEYE